MVQSTVTATLNSLTQFQVPLRTVWARIWETTVSNGAKVGDMLSARLEAWTGTDGVVRETLTVFAGSDAKQASAMFVC